MWMFLDHLNLPTLCTGTRYVDTFLLLVFIVFLIVVIPSSKLFIEFIFEISEVFLCLLLVLHVTSGLLLDVHQPQIPFCKDIDIFRKQLVTVNSILNKLYYGVNTILLFIFC